MDEYGAPITTVERGHLQRSIQIAEGGRLSARPNPVVGAVLAHGADVIGEDFHTAYGELHAEKRLLDRVGAVPSDATLYVSLEPCAHQGKQPPCTDAIIAAGVQRVVYAVDDTNPETAGIGPRVLRDAGIEVVRGPFDLSLEAMRQNVGFHSVNLRRRPFVTYKFATTADGYLATGIPEDRWISSAASRAQVQVLRAMSGAVVVGIETALQDNPLITVRDPELRSLMRTHPLRVVVDRSLRLPPEAALVTSSGPDQPLLVACGPDAPREREEALRAAGVDVWRSEDPDVPPRVLLEYLAFEHSVNDVLLESGPTLAGAWHSMGMLDALVHFRSDRLLGPILPPEVAASLPRIDAEHSISLPLDGAEEVPVGDDIRREATLHPIAAQS